jgi:hypothetical protein
MAPITLFVDDTQHDFQSLGEIHLFLSTLTGSARISRLVMVCQTCKGTGKNLRPRPGLPSVCGHCNGKPVETFECRTVDEVRSHLPMP